MEDSQDIQDTNGNGDFLINFEDPVSDYSNLSQTFIACHQTTDDNMPVHGHISSSILAPSTSQTIGDVNSNVALGNITINAGDSTTVPRESGIILLGRGNSFSLGRSEAIVLNNTRQKRQANNLEGVINSRTANIVEGNTDFNGSHIVEGNANLSGSHGPAPPTISNGERQVPKPNGVQNATSAGHFDELEMLWRKVESIMAAKQGVVQQVLGEFGIGGAGGGGEKDEQRVTEEESVWKVLQDNFQV
ncbi:unnamed protein product [Lymnaea stagnalis]|uniref:Uncharacterized protein n=1 Tax=Lymnaea stagnalis TaxID=6523 RepID=A0AAV2INR8_LYMST